MMIKKYFPEIKSPTTSERKLGYMTCAVVMLIATVLSVTGFLPANISAIMACGAISGIILNMHGLSPTKGIRHVVAMLVLSIPVYVVTQFLIFLFLNK